MSERYEVSIKFGASDSDDEGQRESSVEPSEFRRFEELARTLVSVPKTDIDEKRKAPN